MIYLLSERLPLLIISGLKHPLFVPLVVRHPQSHLTLPCSKRHAKIIRAMTCGDVGAVGSASNSGGAADGTSTLKPGGAKAGTASRGRESAAAGRESAAAGPDSPVTTQAASAPADGAVSLATVGKTVAFLAKLATQGNCGREDGGGGMGDKGSGGASGGGAYG